MSDEPRFDADREVRRIERLELRTTDDGDVILDGYATIYDYRYAVGADPDEGQGFWEVVARGAAAKSATEADVRLLVNHDGIPLARTKSGTLTLESDDIGLRIEARLDPTNPTAIEVRSAMERGDIDQMSLAFRALRQGYDQAANLRTISEMRLFDVSVVTYPANPATVVKLRSEESEAETPERPAGRSLELARRQAEADKSRRR